MIPEQLSEETAFALRKLQEALNGDIAGYVANRLNLSPEELSFALAAEQIEGIALAIYNIEARSQSVIIGDQTGIGKGRQAAAMIRYGMLAGYLPIFLTDRYTLFSDMYRDCKAPRHGKMPVLLSLIRKCLWWILTKSLNRRTIHRQMRYGLRMKMTKMGRR